MKIVNKKKFFVRFIELLVIVLTIIITVVSIKYANKIRGYRAIGGEYLIPIIGLIILLAIEELYQKSENKKIETKSKRKK